MTYRILKLHSENVMRLRAIDITPSDDLVVIAGENDAGKSSVLQSIQMALGGKRCFPDVPLRQGSRNGVVRVEIGDGKPDLVVSLRLGKDGRHTLKIEDAEGNEQRRPMELLGDLIDAVAFEPLSLAGASPKVLSDMLRKAVGLDFTELNAERHQRYTDRTRVNTICEQLQAEVKSLQESLSDVPEALPDVDAAKIAMDRAEALIRANHKESRELEQLALIIRDLHEKEKELDRQISRLQAEYKELGSAIERDERDYANRTKSLAQATLPDIAQLRIDYERAVQLQSLVRDRQRLEERCEALDASREKAKLLSDAIAEIDQTKARQLSDANWPVDGLGFDEDGTITLNALPLSQASQSERLNTVVAIVASMNPKLRVMLVRDASVLGDERLEQLRQIARDRGMQIWAEYATRNADDRPGVPCVLIEDGSVVEEQDVEEPAHEQR